MKLHRVRSQKDRKAFYHFSRELYKNHIHHRATEDEISHLLVDGRSAFHSHATVIPYLIFKDGALAGRFAFIQDQKLSKYVQLSFFEANPNLSHLLDLIRAEAASLFPGKKKLLVGLNGHLNYGAGLLLNKFDEAPVFGLPYNHTYYHDYFTKCQRRTMVSYRFPLGPFYEYHAQLTKKKDFGPISVRKLNKRKLQRDVALYTQLNNACFQDHPYWSDRSVAEDFELFHPFRFFIKEENLLFAELNGEAVGFILWYPDFNQLLGNNRTLGVKELLKYRLSNPINTFRLTEIAVKPGYRSSKITQALIYETISYLKKGSYRYGEGGFIFEENKRSITMSKRFLERATGSELEAYRKFAVYECDL
jgi:ribosomal protein S18 acetylase RimI-like enzyme